MQLFNKYTEELLIFTFEFTFELIKLKLNSQLDSQMRIVLKIGPKEESTRNKIFLKKSQAEINEKLKIQSDIIYSSQKKHYQNLKALMKIYLITSKGQKITGFVPLTLNDFLNENSKPNKIIQKSIKNCPDVEAKIFFKIKNEDITSQKKVSFSNLDDFIIQDSPSFKKAIQHTHSINSSMENGSNLTISIVQDNQDEYDNLSQLINQLKQKNHELQNKLSRDVEKRIKYLQLQQDYKKSQEVNANLLQEYEKQRKQNEILTEKLNAMQKTIHEMQISLEKQKQNQNISTKNCTNCFNLTDQFNHKEKDYEDQLKLLQDLLDQSKSEIKSLQVKNETLMKKTEIMKYKLSKRILYQQILLYIYEQLNILIQKLPIQQQLPEDFFLKKEILNSPQTLKLFFQKYFEFIFIAISEMSMTVRKIKDQFQEDSYPKINLFKVEENGLEFQNKKLQLNLIKEQNYIQKILDDLQHTMERLGESQRKFENLKNQLEMYKANTDLIRVDTDKRSMKSSIKESSVLTPRFQDRNFRQQFMNAAFKDIDFMCEKRFSIKNIEMKDSLTDNIKQDSKSKEEKQNEQIKKLKQKIEELQQSLGNKQKQIRMLKAQILLFHNDQAYNKLSLQLQKQKMQSSMEPQLKDKMISNLQMTIEQLQEDLQQMKDSIQNKNIQISKLQHQKSKIGKSQFQNNQATNSNLYGVVEDQIQNLLKSLQQQQHNESDLSLHDQIIQSQMISQHQQKILNSRSINLPRLKSQITNRLNAISLQFLRMKCFKLSRNKNEAEIVETLNDFKSIKSKIDQFNTYIKTFILLDV